MWMCGTCGQFLACLTAIMHGEVPELSSEQRALEGAAEAAVTKERKERFESKFSGPPMTRRRVQSGESPSAGRAFVFHRESATHWALSSEKDGRTKPARTKVFCVSRWYSAPATVLTCC